MTMVQEYDELQLAGSSDMLARCGTKEALCTGSICQCLTEDQEHLGARASEAQNVIMVRRRRPA